MSNLPKYYFQDIPSEVMDEIMRDMYACRPDMDAEAIGWLAREDKIVITPKKRSFTIRVK